MNLAILSKSETLYSTQSIIKAAEARNHRIDIIDPDYCDLTVENGKPSLFYIDANVENIEAIIPRIGASNTYYGTAVVRQFEAMNVFTAVAAEGILLSRDKWTCFQALSKFNIEVPRTVLVSYVNPEQQLKTFPDKPLIIKIVEGTHGEGVILAESRKNALSIIETLLASRIKFVLQEYIEESKGADIRAIVVDGKVVAAMKRQCKDGDFRSNLHRGGTSEPLKLSSKEEYIAIKAAKAMKLGVCGVDILQSNNGPLILEINSSPGLEGIENKTGIDISKSIIAFLERNKK